MSAGCVEAIMPLAGNTLHHTRSMLKPFIYVCMCVCVRACALQVQPGNVVQLIARAGNAGIPQPQKTWEQTAQDRPGLEVRNGCMDCGGGGGRGGGGGVRASGFWQEVEGESLVEGERAHHCGIEKHVFTQCEDRACMACNDAYLILRLYGAKMVDKPGLKIPDGAVAVEIQEGGVQT
eukprot:198718-Pelagomonas_calceolata.AAC.1